MSQTQWGPLKVQDFFSGYNWTGETPSIDSLEPIQGSIEPSSLLCLKVRDFLQQANWTGKVSQAYAQPTTSEQKTLSITLSVRDFFNGISWGSNQPIFSSASPVISASSKPSPPSPLSVNNLSHLF